MIYKPRFEGKDHINIHPKSKSPLGRALSFNFKSTFKHPIHGLFYSFGAFYFWLLSGGEANDLRNLYGRKVMTLGETKHVARIKNKKFKNEIIEGLWYKIKCNVYIQELLVKNKLPITYYYYYGDPMGKVLVYSKVKEFSYILEAIEEISLNLKKNGIIRN